MHAFHDDHPGRRVRIAYCLNLHAAEDLAGTLEGLRRITLPLRERLVGAAEAPFGVGLYLGGAVAAELASHAGAEGLEALAGLCAEALLDPFTFNAFPYGGFHRAGLKEHVYEPTWLEDERVRFTLDVATIAARLAERAGGLASPAHVSISTHPGAFGAHVRGREDLVACAANLARAVAGLARIESEGGPRCVLSLEAEPRASASDSRELFAFLAFARAETARRLALGDLPAPEPPAGARGVEPTGLATPPRGAGLATPARGAELAARHLGTCLDCCHSAVEFEDPDEALSLATSGGPLGKLQFSSALSLEHPADHPAARELLLAMNEPRYLHQVTGRAGAHSPRANDLPDLRRALAERPAPWLACDSWRCHFHVPVDLASLGPSDAAAGLGTTRSHADALLALALADPSAWTTNDLHVEIETYTWDVLPSLARGPGALVDGLEREYRHVLSRLAAAGWHPRPEDPPPPR